MGDNEAKPVDGRWRSEIKRKASKRNRSAEEYMQDVHRGSEETPRRGRQDKVPRWLGRAEEADSQQDTPEEPLETLAIAIRGGITARVYMSYLATKKLFRWQTGRYKDKGLQEHGLCGADAGDPKNALRAWTVTHGNKLEEDSRSEVMRNVWKKPEANHGGRGCHDGL